MDNWKPEMVSENNIVNANRIITFDCELPSNIGSKNIEQWNGTPPISKDYNTARNIIKEKVTQLIKSLPKD